MKTSGDYPINDGIEVDGFIGAGSGDIDDFDGLVSEEGKGI